MADVKISQLPAATAVADADLIPIVQSGTTKQVTFLAFKNSEGIYTGTGAPAISAPNGSMFLRTDGTANTTLYVRVSGAWTPLST